MTDEERQRTIDFILQQQASFASGMEQLRESHTQAEKRISSLEIGFVNITNTLTNITKVEQALAERITQLAEAQARVSEDIAELREAQAHTDQRVNALIDIIERWRNGGPQS